MRKKIYICTTFRDFNGSLNDQLQKAYLYGIKNQTYSNFELVVTLFGEKKVEENVREIVGDKCSFIDEGKKDYKYSLSTVFLNGLKKAKEEKDSILIWSTSDIVLDDNYFETIIKNYHESLAGITHPNRHAAFLGEDMKSNSSFADFTFGIDILFFSTKVLLQKECMEAIEKYRFFGWGVFENFLATLGAEYAGKCINTVNISDVYKVANDREAAQETNLMLSDAAQKNLKVYEKYLKDYHKTYKYRYLLYCHMKYKVLKRKLAYRMAKFKFEKNKFIIFFYCCIPEFIYRRIKKE